jgi:hypothetical protein
VLGGHVTDRHNLFGRKAMLNSRSLPAGNDEPFIFHLSTLVPFGFVHALRYGSTALRS